MPRHATKPGPRAPQRTTVQYTVRDVPAHVDRLLRRRAAEERVSLNRFLQDVMARAVGAETEAPVYHDLDALAGAWEDDPAFDRAIAEQDRVDEKLWR